MLLLSTLTYLLLLTVVEYVLEPFIPGLGAVSPLLRVPLLFGLSFAVTYLLVYVISVYHPTFRVRLQETVALVGVKWWSSCTFLVSTTALVYPLIAYQQLPGEMVTLLLLPIAGISLLNSLGIETTYSRLTKTLEPDTGFRPLVLPQSPLPEEAQNEDDCSISTDDSDESSGIEPTKPEDEERPIPGEDEPSDSDQASDDVVVTPSDIESPEEIFDPLDLDPEELDESDEGTITIPLAPSTLPNVDPDKSPNTYHWEFEGKPYKLSLNISKQTYDELKSRPRCLDISDWGRVYVTDGITDAIRQLVIKLLETGMGYGTYKEVSFVLSFVQSVIRYQHDVGEYPKYPLETLVEGTGDCEDFSILGAAILKCMDYDVALLVMPGHVALGVAGAGNLPGTYVSHNGIRYYYCEMTAKGWLIGDIPDGERDSSFEVTTIEKPPPRVVVPDGL